MLAVILNGGEADVRDLAARRDMQLGGREKPHCMRPFSG